MKRPPPRVPNRQVQKHETEVNLMISKKSQSAKSVSIPAPANAARKQCDVPTIEQPQPDAPQKLPYHQFTQADLDETERLVTEAEHMASDGQDRPSDALRLKIARRRLREIQQAIKQEGVYPPLQKNTRRELPAVNAIAFHARLNRYGSVIHATHFRVVLACHAVRWEVQKDYWSELEFLKKSDPRMPEAVGKIFPLSEHDPFHNLAEKVWEMFGEFESSLGVYAVGEEHLARLNTIHEKLWDVNSQLEDLSLEVMHAWEAGRYPVKMVRWEDDQ